MTFTPVDLEEGLVLRPATTADRDAIIDLSIEAHGEAELWGITSLVDGAGVGLDRFTVVIDGDRVVSTLCLMARTLVVRHGDAVVEIPLGQPEYVATAAAYRKRRLVRRQLDVVHGWSEDRGDLAQLIVGIPYFYRRFGYEQALGFAIMELGEVSSPSGWDTRRATTADLEAVLRLDRAALAQAAVATPVSEAAWTRFVEGGRRCNYEAYVAERNGEIGGMGLLVDWGEKFLYAGGIAATDPDGARAVLAAVAERAAPRQLRAFDRAGTAAGAALATVARRAGDFGVYLRVADPVALLDRLRPVLDARLAASAWAAWSGEAVLSLYERGIRFSVEEGRVAGVDEVAGHHDPTEVGQAACPPDLIATLIFGRVGPEVLEERADDVDLSPHRDLISTLFPRQAHDLPTEI
jgi:predicted N-acetyltransferase YhbS